MSRPTASGLVHVGRVVAHAEDDDRTELRQPVEVLCAHPCTGGCDRDRDAVVRPRWKVVERHRPEPLPQRRLELRAERTDHRHPCLSHTATVARHTLVRRSELRDHHRAALEHATVDGDCTPRGVNQRLARVLG